MPDLPRRLEARIMPTLPGPLTYNDYVKIPSDGRRHEIIDGHHVVNAAPNTRHQAVLGRLFVQLFTTIDRPGLGRVFIAPTDVLLSERDVVEPDIVVILNRSLEAGTTKILDPYIDGPPDLVVEVASPSTATFDRTTKRDLYARRGVGAYWIVDPAERRVDVLHLRNGVFEPAPNDDRLHVDDGIEPIDVSSLWS